MTVECKLCGFKSKNLRGHASHLNGSHPEYTIEKYWREIKNPDPCPGCGGPVKWIAGADFRKTCCSKECLAKTAPKHTEQAKAKMRKKRLERLAKRKGDTAWERRWAGTPSYLEMWFIDNVISKHKLAEKHQIICEFPVSVYTVDFAFPELKLAVELDGKCHFVNGRERIDHDIKRDQFLKEKGWDTYRIPYFLVENNPSGAIEQFLSFFNDYTQGVVKTQDVSPSLMWYKEWKEKHMQPRPKKLSREEKRIRRREAWVQKQQGKKEELLASGIDFGKFGWVGKAAVLIEISPQKVGGWMKKVMPEFYEEKCFKRPRRKRVN